VAVSLLRTLLMNRMAGLTQRFNSHIHAADRRGPLAPLLAEAAVAVAAGAAVTAARDAATTGLALAFRSRLTAAVHAVYFSRSAYYHISNLPGRQAIADADQRVSSEVASVATRLTSVVTLLVKAGPPLLWFTYRLWVARGWRVAFVPHLYLLLAYEVAQRLFPKNIGDLYRRKAAAESGFNRGISRLMTHSEAVMSLSGDAREMDILEGLHDKVHTATVGLHRGTSLFGLIFKIAYSFGCRTWLTCFVMLPPPIAVAVADIPAFYATTRFSLQVMLEMLVANGNLLTLHATAMHMKGSAKRLCVLLDTLGALNADQQAKATGTMRAGDRIEFADVEIQTPSRNVLVKDLSFKLGRGQSLLLTGHNGAGKSSIFRVLGGLWPTPTGTITKPGLHSAEPHRTIFYLPQKPYSRLGTLRDNVVYPSEGGVAAEARLPDNELMALLKLVDLEHLLSHGVSRCNLTNWEAVLSLGEQQRLGMARLFFHKPAYAILDECTSSVSSEMELLLYRECQRLNITYITICHRPSLRIWHTHSLHLLGDGKGGYTFGPIQHTAEEKLAIAEQSRQLRAGQNASTKAVTQSYALALQERSAPFSAPVRESTSREKSSRHQSGPSKLLRLLKICLPGSEWRLGAFAIGILLRTAVHEMYAYAVGRLFGAAVGANSTLFFRLCALQFVTDQTAAVIEEAVIFLQHMVGAAWHRKLALHCTSRLMSHGHYYTLRNRDGRVTDADQRISEEVKVATDAIADLFGRAIMPSIDMIWFSSSLYRLMGLRGLLYIAGYAAVSASTVRLFEPDNEALNRREKELESTFKFVHNRLRNHAESIAFYHADDAEHAIARQTYGDLKHQAAKNRRTDAVFRLFELMVNKDFGDPSDMLSTPDVVTYMLELDYVDRIGGDGGKSVTSAGFYISAAAQRAFSAFGKLSNIYSDLKRLLGSADRVVELLDVMDEMERTHPGGGVTLTTDCDGASIEMKDIDIVTPDGVCLASDLTLSVPPRQSLMVTGRNATGKTSLFRCLAGLWSVPKGSVQLPVGGMQLVPQKCYSVTGSLADQLTYPKHISPNARTAEHEAQMQDALKSVGVEYLVYREGGWDATKRWEDTLSLGEQQRIGLARVMYHRPAFAVLDECTDAVSIDAERALYTALFEGNVTCITISKRLALEEFHSKHLTLGEASQSGWSLYDLNQPC